MKKKYDGYKYTDMKISQLENKKNMYFIGLYVIIGLSFFQKTKRNRYITGEA